MYLRDVGTIQDATDIVVGYAHVNGRRTVYIPVTKRADASTLEVIHTSKLRCPRCARWRTPLPPDVQIDFVFDQSPYVVERDQRPDP